MTKQPDTAAIAEAAAHLYSPFDEAQSPGAALAVLCGDKIAIRRCYGSSNVEFDVRWEPTTRYPIASITKTVVADVLCRLQQEGVLSLSWPVNRFFRFANEALGKATLAQLAMMSAGLRHDEVAASLVGVEGACNAALVAQTLAQSRPQYMPGQMQRYSCAGYRLLALVIEKVSGLSFADALEQLTFRPLDMRDSLTFVDWRGSHPRLAHHYRRGNQTPWLRWLQDGESSGDGAVISTLDDLITFARYMRSCPTAEADSRWQTLAAFRFNPALSSGYGLGVQLRTVAGLTVIGHSGSTNCQIAYAPQLDLTLICLHNHDALHNSQAVRALLAAATGAARVAPLPGSRQEANPAFAVEGLYADQSSGLVLMVQGDGNSNSEPVLSLKMLDRRAELARVSGDRRTLNLVESSDAIEIVIDQEVASQAHALIVREGAGPPARCSRVELSPPAAALVEPLCGWYHCVDMSACICCVLSEKGFELVLGNQSDSGSRLLLEWCGSLLFYCDGTTVRFEHDPQTGARMLVNRALCRDLTFTRMKA